MLVLFPRLSLVNILKFTLGPIMRHRVRTRWGEVVSVAPSPPLPKLVRMDIQPSPREGPAEVPNGANLSPEVANRSSLFLDVHNGGANSSPEIHNEDNDSSPQVIELIEIKQEIPDNVSITSLPEDDEFFPVRCSDFHKQCAKNSRKIKILQIKVEALVAEKSTHFKEFRASQKEIAELKKVQKELKRIIASTRSAPVSPEVDDGNTVFVRSVVLSPIDSCNSANHSDASGGTLIIPHSVPAPGSSAGIAKRKRINPNSSADQRIDSASTLAPPEPVPNGVVEETIQTHPSTNESVGDNAGAQEPEDDPYEPDNDFTSTSPVQTSRYMTRTAARRISTEKKDQHGVDRRASMKTQYHKCFCGMRFRSLRKLQLHIHDVVERWNYKCHECGVIVYQLSHLKQHLHLTHNEKLVGESHEYCSECGEMFPSYAAKRKHYYDVHTDHRF